MRCLDRDLDDLAADVDAYMHSAADRSVNLFPNLQTTPINWLLRPDRKGRVQLERHTPLNPR